MSASRTRRRMLRMLMLAWLLSRMGELEVEASTGSDAYTAKERAEVVQQVESSLLSLFGFERRPKPIDRSKVHVPQAMIDLYRKHTGKEVQFTSNFRKPGLHTRSANTVRSFTHQESPIDAKFSGYHKFRLYFDVSTVPEKEKLKAAEVALTRESVEWLTNEHVQNRDHLQHILVHDIVRPGRKGKHGPILRLIDSKMVDTRQNASVNVDALPAVERWLENGLDNHGLIIEVISRGRNKTRARHLRLKRDAESQTEWAGRQPLLFTYTDDGKNVQRTAKEIVNQRRARRASMKKHRRKGRELCQRHPLYVDFNDVGWTDWIVAPPGYDAFYCSGDCTFPLPDHMNTTNHAVIQTLVNSATPSVVPKACCVPTQLNAISMLYLDEANKVVLKNYQDMTVVGCGCR